MGQSVPLSYPTVAMFRGTALIARHTDTTIGKIKGFNSSANTVGKRERGEIAAAISQDEL
jgi:hypothetical protein